MPPERSLVASWTTKSVLCSRFVPAVLVAIWTETETQVFAPKCNCKVLPTRYARTYYFGGVSDNCIRGVIVQGMAMHFAGPSFRQETLANQSKATATLAMVSSLCMMAMMSSAQAATMSPSFNKLRKRPKKGSKAITNSVELRGSPAAHHKVYGTVESNPPPCGCRSSCWCRALG